MSQGKYRTILTGLIITLPVITQAAERVVLNKATFSDLSGVIQINLPTHQLQSETSSSALHFLNQHTDTRGVTHIRMQQKYLGFPVLGGYAILHSPYPTKNIRAQDNIEMSGAIYQGLKEELGEPSALFIEQKNIALSHFKKKFLHQPIIEEQVTPIVYVNEKHQAIWAYKVSLFIQPDDAIPLRPTAILDAKTFLPFKQWNDLKTIAPIRVKLTPVKGMGFGGNKRVGEYEYGKQNPALNISRNDYTELCYLENPRVRVVDMDYTHNKPSFPMEFYCYNETSVEPNTYWTGYRNDGYDLSNGGYSPSNDALYIGELIINMYKKWYDFDALQKANKPMQLVMRVHFGKRYENAFWDGRQMTFGDGDGMFYPLVSLSVGAHEVSHGFTEQHSDLEYYGQSGGMNESFSDMAAQAVEYYVNGEASWKIGSEILKRSEDEALRFMDKPSRDGYSIDNATQYHKKLDVHQTSGVYNHLFYILANRPGWNPRTAFHVMLKANMDYWTPNSTFDEGACGVLKAAEDLELSTDDVKYALDEVAVKYEACV